MEAAERAVGAVNQFQEILFDRLPDDQILSRIRFLRVLRSKPIGSLMSRNRGALGRP